MLLEDIYLYEVKSMLTAVESSRIITKVNLVSQASLIDTDIENIEEIHAHSAKENITIRKEPSWSDDDYSICANTCIIHTCPLYRLHIGYQGHTVYQMSV